MSAMPAAPAKSNGSVGVKSSLPIDFSLYDENLHYLLYITDDPTEEHKLKLELKNTSGQTIELPAPKAPTTRENSNFELHFRKGTLSDKTLNILLGKDTQIKSLLSPDDQNDWDIGLDENSSGTKAHISLYFRRQGSAALNPDSPMILTLQHISADAGSGARGTRVEFIPQKMIFNSGKNTPVTGNREQHLFITNHSGQKYIPLHVGFVGSNRILNDGQVHNDLPLTLRIQNIAKPAKPGQETSIILKADQKPPSQFTISFDAQEGEDKSKPWALCKASELVTVVSTGTAKPFQLGKQTTVKGLIYETGSKEWKPTTDASLIKVSDPTVGVAQSRELAVTFQKDIKLNSGDYIEIVLSGFQSSLPSGFAHMYVNYNNVPGYWDGHFVLTVEKTPLLFSDSNNIGIGFTKPNAKLAINGGLHVGGDSDPGDDNLLVDGKLTITGAATFNGNVGIATTNAQIHLAIGDNDTGLKQQGDGNLAIYTNNAERVRIDPNGNVGIGTTSPAAKLEISANLKATKADDTLVALKVAPSFDGNNQTGVKTYGLLVTDGKVGIGTTAPESQLHVKIPKGPLDFNQAIRVQTNDGDYSDGLGGGIITQNADMVTAGIFGIRESGYQGALAFYTHTSSVTDTNKKNVFGTNFTEKMRITSSGNVGIGTNPNPSIKLHIIASEQDAGQGTLGLGPIDKSNLRLGYHADYSWIQSHGGKPLKINPLGNDVIIGGLAILRGTINSNATVKNGMGFKVSKLDTGRYLITFDNAFTSEPSASVTQIFADGNTLDNAVIMALDKDKMKVKTGRNTGEAGDRDFSFILIGPR